MLEDTIRWCLIKAAADQAAAAAPVDTSNWTSDPGASKSKEQIRAEMFGTVVTDPHATAMGTPVPPVSAPTAATPNQQQAESPKAAPQASIPAAAPAPAQATAQAPKPAQPVQPQFNYANYDRFGEDVDWNPDAYKKGQGVSSIGGVGRVSAAQFDAYLQAFANEKNRQIYNGADPNTAVLNARKAATGWVRNKLKLDSNLTQRSVGTR